VAAVAVADACAEPSGAPTMRRGPTSVGVRADVSSGRRHPLGKAKQASPRAGHAACRPAKHAASRVNITARRRVGSARHGLLPSQRGGDDPRSGARGRSKPAYRPAGFESARHRRRPDPVGHQRPAGHCSRGRRPGGLNGLVLSGTPCDGSNERERKRDAPWFGQAAGGSGRRRDGTAPTGTDREAGARRGASGVSSWVRPYGPFSTYQRPHRRRGRR
jgi:hypothetical protein